MSLKLKAHTLIASLYWAMAITLENSSLFGGQLEPKPLLLLTLAYPWRKEKWGRHDVLSKTKPTYALVRCMDPFCHSLRRGRCWMAWISFGPRTACRGIGHLLGFCFGVCHRDLPCLCLRRCAQRCGLDRPFCALCISSRTLRWTCSSRWQWVWSGVLVSATRLWLL